MGLVAQTAQIVSEGFDSHPPVLKSALGLPAHAFARHRSQPCEVLSLSVGRKSCGVYFAEWQAILHRRLMAQRFYQESLRSAKIK